MNIEKYLKENLNAGLLSESQEIKAQFDQVASYLLKNCSIFVNERSYKLAEIEFYYHSDQHQDPYVHKDDNQKQMGWWYFHDSGIDFTFGDDDCYGGILIRALKEINTDRYIEGPLNVFDELFNQGFLLEESNRISVVLRDEDESALKEDVYSYPRVGLFPNANDNALDFLLKSYRYLLHPWDSKVERSIIYLYHKYIEENNKVLDKLKTDKSMVKDYESAFREGQNAYAEINNRIMPGKKMTVKDKCFLLGWQLKHDH